MLAAPLGQHAFGQHAGTIDDVRRMTQWLVYSQTVRLTWAARVRAAREAALAALRHRQRRRLLAAGMAALRANVRARRYLRWHVNVWARQQAVLRRFVHWRDVARSETAVLRRTWNMWCAFHSRRQHSKAVVMAWLHRVHSLHLMHGFHTWRERTRLMGIALHDQLMAQRRLRTRVATMRRVVDLMLRHSVRRALVRWSVFAKATKLPTVAMTAAAEPPSPSPSRVAPRYSVWWGTSLHRCVTNAWCRPLFNRWRRAVAGHTAPPPIVAATIQQVEVVQAQVQARPRPRKQRENPVTKTSHPLGEVVNCTFVGPAAQRYARRPNSTGACLQLQTRGKKSAVAAPVAPPDVLLKGCASSKF
jgi:hypothetical protein